MAPSKTLTITAHIVGWFLFFSLVLGFMVSMKEGNMPLTNALSWSFLAFCLTYLCLFYINSYWLLPKLYLQKHYFGYFIIILLLFIAYYWIKPFETFVVHHGPREAGFRPPHPGPNFDRLPRGRPGPAIDIVSLVLFIMIWAVSTALQIIKQWRTTEQRAAQAETEKAQAELSFLKAQINPHFLFNTLNNIYSLSVMKSDAAPEAIMKLSHIMRYVTDESSHAYVPLEQEIQCITNYIELQRLRLNEKTKIDFSIEGYLKHQHIAPLILMPFVENVFKYGVSSHEASLIQIKLFIEDSQLVFFCQNSIFKTSKTEERSGVGIENTQKRLFYLYPNKHNLTINTTNNLFTVRLQLSL